MKRTVFFDFRLGSNQTQHGQKLQRPDGTGNGQITGCGLGAA
ncbi:hypothetical protein [Escherichia coli]